VRELKKELKDAEAAILTAKEERDALGRKYLEARGMAISDTERIMEEVKTRTGTTELGANAIDDIIAVSNHAADLVKLASVIGASGKGPTQVGACEALLRLQEPPVGAIKALYSGVLEQGVKSLPEVFPVVATAIGRFGSEKDAEALVSTVLAKSEKMSQEKEPRYSAYSTYQLNECHIIHLLSPTLQTMRQESSLAASTKVVEEACRAALLKSVNTVEPTANCSMPKEAAIAAKFKYPEVERMLLSPTETSISLNLSKAGRKHVHDMIRLIEYGKLSDDSTGTGRDRVLVIRKTSAPAEEQVKARKERKDKHKELLQSMAA